MIVSWNYEVEVNMLPTVFLPDLQPEFVLQIMSEVYDWGLMDLNVPLMHKHTLGEGIKIGIIDSGRSEHFETVNNTVESKNFTESPSVVDKNGHSTFIAGVIAAEKNDEGIVGVAPEAKLYFAKSMDDAGRGSPSSLARAVAWCASKKVDIISISAGMFFDFKPLRRAVTAAYNKNIIIVAATGNTGTRHFDVAFPARYPEVIGVAAYDQNHRVAKFSSRGANVSCAMPGVDIYSCHLDNNFCKSNGTSFACPMLAGICALVLAYHRKLVNPETPCETPRQMMEHLKKYAKDLNSDAKSVGFGTLHADQMFNSD